MSADAEDEPARERRAYGTRLLRRRLRSWGWLFAAGLGLVVWQISSGDGFNQAYSLMVFALMALAVFVVATSFYPHSEDEAAWRSAVVRRQWDDALGLASRLPRSPGEQALLRARALTGLGRWDDAQALIKATDPDDLPQGRYWELVADVFETRGDAAARRRALERAVHEHPRPLYIMLALAEIALVEDRDPRACKTWLDRVRDRDKPDVNSAAMLTLRGGMAYEEGDWTAAAPLLERALDVVETELAKAPEAERWRGTMQAYLSMTRARLGQAAEARILARGAAPWLAKYGPEALKRRMAEARSEGA